MASPCVRVQLLRLRQTTVAEEGAEKKNLGPRDREVVHTRETSFVADIRLRAHEAGNTQNHVIKNWPCQKKSWALVSPNHCSPPQKKNPSFRRFSMREALELKAER